MPFELRKSYSRKQINEILGGGSIQEYLPSKDGIILAGCFVPDLNPLAPQQIFIGSGPRITSQAERAVLQRQPFPCFIKQGNKEHMYVGMFVPQFINRLASDIRKAEIETGRTDITGILHLIPFVPL